MVDELNRVLEEQWDRALNWFANDDDWVSRSMTPLVRAAHAVPQLRALFPFASHNRLCFSRCSTYPFTADCPCIAAQSDQYQVQARWTVADEPAPVLLETTDLDEALGIVVAHLPAERSVWLGDADHPPD